MSLVCSVISRSTADVRFVAVSIGFGTRAAGDEKDRDHDQKDQRQDFENIFQRILLCPTMGGTC